MKKICRNCNYFNYIYYIYYDNLEPDGVGECHKSEEYPIHSDCCAIHCDDSCKDWENIPKPHLKLISSKFSKN